MCKYSGAEQIDVRVCACLCVRVCVCVYACVCTNIAEQVYDLLCGAFGLGPHLVRQIRSVEALQRGREDTEDMRYKYVS